MIGRYAILAGRIRQDLADIDRAVQRVDRAIRAAARLTDDRDLYVDSAALNLHDAYSALERLFELIATTVDQSVPSDHDWHRELLRQMTVDLEGLRPAVLTVETVVALDEYRRFRQVVRNVYAYNLDLGRIEQLGLALGPLFARVRSELLAFAAALDGLARAE